MNAFARSFDAAAAGLKSVSSEDGSILCPALSGTNYSTLSGGNSAGIFNEAALTGIASSVAEVTV